MMRRIIPDLAPSAARIVVAAALAVSAVAAVSQPLPERRHVGVVTYVSGGIGSDEAQYMQSIRQDFNLRLLFANKTSGQYVANVRVDIGSTSGAALASLVSDGPFFYARLPEGAYRVRVTYEGAVQTADVDLRQGRAAALQFYWPEGE
ncbi:MAG: carboxypeptidase-like regulatory domain-containing protein [Bordetella sp.]